MADLGINAVYKLQLNHEEFCLVGLALACKIKEGSREAQDAHKLNLKLLELRSHQLTELKNLVDAALTSEKQRTITSIQPKEENAQ